MMMYAIGTAACAFAPNMATLVFFRIIASLGIGGEWAAGAAMVAEVVPEHRRVEAGALLYTAAPFGLFLATMSPIKCRACTLPAALKWRGAMCSSLACYPRRWRSCAIVHKRARAVEARGESAAPPQIRELFTPKYRAITISGLLMAVVALITWWSCNAFISVVATGLASEAAAGLPPVQATALVES